MPKVLQSVACAPTSASAPASRHHGTKAARTAPIRSSSYDLAAPVRDQSATA